MAPLTGPSPETDAGVSSSEEMDIGSPGPPDGIARRTEAEEYNQTNGPIWHRHGNAREC